MSERVEWREIQFLHTYGDTIVDLERESERRFETLCDELEEINGPFDREQVRAVANVLIASSPRNPGGTAFVRLAVLRALRVQREWQLECEEMWRRAVEAADA